MLKINTMPYKNIYKNIFQVNRNYEENMPSEFVKPLYW